MSEYEKLPKWQRELISFKGIKSTFIIEGNIKDQYLSVDTVNGKNSYDFLYLNETLDAIFNDRRNETKYDILFCDPLFGLSDPLNKNTVADGKELVRRFQKMAKQQREETELFNENRDANDNMVKISEIIRAAITLDSESISNNSVAIVVNFASRLISSPERLDSPENTMFLNLLYASKNATRVNGNMKTLILVVDKFNDIPAWFYLNNPNIRMVTITNPDRAIREAFVTTYFTELNSSDKMLSKLKDKLVDLTEGMKILELDDLRRVYKKGAIPVTEITDIVSIYKFGFRENKWSTMRDRLRGRLDGDIASVIRERVKGQEDAISKICGVIKRSVTGLSGMQHSSSENKPRGILFLAGPTGTGKTESVKTVAELLFGDEKALLRFDMSEYTAEHADQKLFGAPPGYIGYDQGGQLTNAVKSNPFSVLLFDEIEKAHPSIMDKFLQILEDGRMTDGQGNTVYFSETLIFFTSNAGITEEICDANGRIIKRDTIVNPEDPYEKIQKTVEAALKIRFKPEVLNRIGKNIIVFNYITETATSEILRSQLDTITQGIFRKNKVVIEIDTKAIEYLFKRCLENETRANGGRGIGNVVESYFLNPLSEFMFDARINQHVRIAVKYAMNNLIFERA